MTLEDTGTISSLPLSLSPSLPPFNRSSLDACCMPGVIGEHWRVIIEQSRHGPPMGIFPGLELERSSGPIP